MGVEYFVVIIFIGILLISTYSKDFDDIVLIGGTFFLAVMLSFTIGREYEDNTSPSNMIDKKDTIYEGRYII